MASHWACNGTQWARFWCTVWDVVVQGGSFFRFPKCGANVLCSLKTIWFPKMDSAPCGHVVNYSRVHYILYLFEHEILCIKIRTDGTNF